MALDRLAKPLHGRTDADDAQIVAHRIVVVLSQKCYGTLRSLPFSVSQKPLAVRALLFHLAELSRVRLTIR